MKSGQSRMALMSSPGAEFELDKTQCKFNRKQVLGSDLKKKYKSIHREEDKMCYMSPDKLTMMLSSRSNSIYEGKSPISSHFLGSPGFIRQEESFIRNLGDNSESEPMNDSLLSIYNELDRDVHQREQVERLEGEVGRLNDLVEQLREEGAAKQEKLEQIGNLEEYLMQRQAYICEIHEQNIALMEKTVKLSKQKELIGKENQYLRKLRQKEKEQHEIDLQQCKGQLQQQKQKAEVSQQQLQRFQEARGSFDSLEIISPDTSLDQTVVQRAEYSNDYGQLANSPLKLSQVPSSFERVTPKQKDDHPFRRSYMELLSSRSGKVANFYDDEEESDGTLKSRPHGKNCSCRSTIQSLYQKIRYSQIQIDILKRVKANGQNFREENEKLKRQNSHLNSRIDYLLERRKEKKRKDSGSSLELSLSPHRSKRR